MTSIVMILLGAGVGLGAWMSLRSLQPRPIPLSDVTVILDRQGVPIGTTADDGQLAGGQTLLASIGATLMQAIGQADKPSLAEQLLSLIHI